MRVKESKQRNISYKVSAVDYILLSFIPLVGAVILVLCIFKLTVGNVDVLAFSGAVIGGLLTFLGVRVTIHSSYEALREQISEQRKDKFLESIQQKIEAISNVQVEIGQCYYDFGAKPDETTSRVLNGHYGQHLSKLRRYAAGIDWQFYSDFLIYEERFRELFLNDAQARTLESLFITDDPEARQEIKAMVGAYSLQVQEMMRDFQMTTLIDHVKRLENTFREYATSQ